MEFRSLRPLKLPTNGFFSSFWVLFYNLFFLIINYLVWRTCLSGKNKMYVVHITTLLVMWKLIISIFLKSRHVHFNTQTGLWIYKHNIRFDLHNVFLWHVLDSYRSLVAFKATSTVTEVPFLSKVLPTDRLSKSDFHCKVKMF